ncbi:MAG: hypothetical protein LBB77_09080 [Treponema sp.]|jgi:hypothetical protein|nr:hypothetical protein [Treponema sp.]
MKRALVLPLLLLVWGGLRAQEESGGVLPWIFHDIIPGGHQGKVNSVYYDGQRLLSAGEDGFLGIWDPGERRALVRFQLSDLPVLDIARRPGKSQIACIEDDGLGHCRISVWDYRSLENLFTLRFQDPVQNISYSAGGSYLTVSRSGRTGVVLVEPETGEILLDSWNTPEEFPSSAAFAVIGRTERAMLVYSPLGGISYWELNKDQGLRLNPVLDDYGVPLNFEAPEDLFSPLLFGNNGFFAGFDDGGLVVLRADTGFELDRDRSLSRGKLAAWGKEFYCLAVSANLPGERKAGAFTGREGIYRFRLDDSGTLVRAGFYPFPVNTVPSAMALIPREGNSQPLIVIGTQGGELLPLNPDSPYSVPAPLKVKKQTPITEAAAGRERIAFLAGEGALGFIPLDFFEMKDGAPLVLENGGGYTRLSAAEGGPRETGEADRFILWQDRSPLPYPTLRSPETGTGLLLPLSENSGPGGPFARAFPLRSVSVLEDRGLFLDMGGNVTVLSLGDAGVRYTESSAGSIDAAFINQDSIILGRGLSGDPFLMIDTRTRETVPIPYPAAIGTRVYRGPSGTIYGAAVEETAGGLRTSIIRLNSQDPAASERLVEYLGEDAGLSIAEAGGFMASTLGGIYRPWGMLGLERGPAIPLRIAGGDLYFIVLDAEGGISWHDPRTGEMLALFRLYEDEWTLGIAGAGLLRGGLRR